MANLDSRALRMVKLVHLIDQGIRSVADDGCDSEGRPNQQRQHLIELLKKRVIVDGREIPLFRLAERPPPCAYPDTKQGQRIRANDRFDRDHLIGDDGQYRTPSPEWRAISDAQRARYDQRQADVDDQVAQRTKAAAGDAVAALVSMTQKAAKTKPQAAGSPA